MQFWLIVLWIVQDWYLERQSIEVNNIRLYWRLLADYSWSFFPSIPLDPRNKIANNHLYGYQPSLSPFPYHKMSWKLDCTESTCLEQLSFPRVVVKYTLQKIWPSTLPSKKISTHYENMPSSRNNKRKNNLETISPN